MTSYHLLLADHHGYRPIFDYFKHHLFQCIERTIHKPYIETWTPGCPFNRQVAMKTGNNFSFHESSESCPHWHLKMIPDVDIRKQIYQHHGCLTFNLWKAVYSAKPTAKAKSQIMMSEWVVKFEIQPRVVVGEWIKLDRYILVSITKRAERKLSKLPGTTSKSIG